MKWDCDLAKRMFRLGSWLKMRFITISKVSWSGILVKRLVTSTKQEIFWKDLHS